MAQKPLKEQAPGWDFPRVVRHGCLVLILTVVAVLSDTTLGEHTIINTGATVDHDCVIGDFVHIAPGAHLAGNVHVDEGALLGIGSCVIPGCKIGKDTIIGAGATVICDVPSGCHRKRNSSSVDKNPLKEHRGVGKSIRRGCFVLILTVVTVIVIIGIFAYPLWLPQIYKYLDVSEPPQKADVLVVLGGSYGRRETFAVELYKEGYAPRILVSGGDDESLQQGLSIIRESGIPENALLVNDQATSTYDEAQQVLDLLLQTDAKSALIVTDPFHTRRALATYKHVFQGHNITLTIVSPDENIDPNSWWISGFKDEIMTELIKLPYYWLVYGVGFN